MRNPLAAVIEKTYGPLPKVDLAPLVRADVHVMAIVKHATRERFVILFDDDHKIETLRTLAHWATEPTLSFTWVDAAVLSQKVRSLE